MMKCPLCGHAAHTRTSREFTNETKERYNQCQNLNCGATFVSHETFVKYITKPNLINEVIPHPTNERQVAMGF